MICLIKKASTVTAQKRHQTAKIPQVKFNFDSGSIGLQCVCMSHNLKL